MIIVDFQQTMIASIMMQIGFSGGSVEVPMFKHMVLNSLRSYRQKWTAKYGELVIACDTGSSWRKSNFPYYKANRKKDKEESSLDWDSIFVALEEVRNDLQEFFPYRIIRVEGAEADDVIGTLCYRFGTELPGGEPILILSGDKDFKQLQKFMNVEQYDAVRKKAIVENNPENYLIEHIIKGDRGDGIPNILSPDGCFVRGERQGTMTAKRMSNFIQCAFNGEWDTETVQRNYARNSQLIDLKNTPQSLKDEINAQYDSQLDKGRDKIFGYLMKNRMKHLMEYVNEF